MATLGEDLKVLREKARMTLEEASQRTRISRRFLEYIETNRFELLPGGVFTRAFIRTYAELLGADSRDVLRRFETMTPSAPEKTRRAEPVLRRHGPFLRFLFSSIVTVTLLGLAGVLLYREILYRQSQIEEARNQIPPVPDVATLPTTTVVTVEGVQTSSTLTTPSAAETVPSTYPLNLTIEAINQCWISVNADGRQITSQLLARGDRLPFHANTQFSLILGNSGGVQLKVNGQPLRKIGMLGEVKKLVITLDNYKEYMPETGVAQP